MFTYSAIKGVKSTYQVWDEVNGETVAYGIMTKNGAVWEIRKDGSADVVGVGKTRDFALAELPVYEAAQKLTDELSVTKPASIHIDAATAYYALGLAVEERGQDFVYRDKNSGTHKARPNDGVTKGVAPSYHESWFCRYEWNGAPSCGVGLALRKLGVPLDVLKTWDNGIEGANPKGSGISEVDFPDNVDITDNARRVFSEFQMAQDDSKTWGKALELARVHMV